MTIILAAIAVLLLIICISLTVRLAIIKHELRRTAEEIRLYQDPDYNRMLTVTLIDRDLTGLINELNVDMEYKKKLKLGNERSEQALKQSVSDIAHDLRTPLTVIKGSLQMLELEEPGSPRSSEYIRVCQEKTDRMKKMADDFFEMSLLESEQTVALMEELDAVKLVTEFIADNAPMIISRKLAPDIWLPEHSCMIKGDPQLILRVLENLLNNVMKYASGGFRIELTEGDGHCGLTFANMAYGLSQDDIGRLFERSYRADKSRSGGSAGLGLYIVRLLMEKQGGSVSAALQGNELQITARFLKA